MARGPSHQLLRITDAAGEFSIRRPAQVVCAKSGPGLGGVWLLASMSWFIASNQQRFHASTRWIPSMVAQATSWLAVAGILYPLITVIGGGLTHDGR